MKRRSRLILPLAAFSLLFSVAVTACGGGNNNQQQSGTEEKITITAEGNKKALILGESVQLTASINGVTWSSSDEAVATVSPSGLVESKAVGKTTIKAVKSGYKDGSKIRNHFRRQSYIFGLNLYKSVNQNIYCS